MTGAVVIGWEATPQGEDAVRLGRLLASALQAPITLATVFPLPAHLIPATEIAASLEREAPGIFARPKELLEEPDAGTRVVVDPSPARALQEIAEAERAALIVVGSCHRGALGRTMLGSVATSLLHGSPCPVAVAPRGFGKQAEQGNIRRIGVAFDGTAEGFAALETAIALARRFDDAAIGLLTVCEPQSYGIETTYAILTAADWEAAERNERRRVLDLGLARVPGDLRAEGRLLDGVPGPALAEAAEDFDLMVTGSRGYGPVRRTLLGSTAARLMGAAPRPVLVVPRGGAAGAARASE